MLLLWEFVFYNHNWKKTNFQLETGENKNSIFFSFQFTYPLNSIKDTKLGVPRVLLAMPTGKCSSCSWRLKWMWGKITNIYIYIFISSVHHICCDLQQCCVCIRLFVYKTLETSFSTPDAVKIFQILNEFFIHLTEAQTSCAGGPTYPLAESLLWPKCFAALPCLGHVLVNTASSARLSKQQAPLGDPEPHVRWAEK